MGKCGIDGCAGCRVLQHVMISVNSLMNPKGNIHACSIPELVSHDSLEAAMTGRTCCSSYHSLEHAHH